MVFGDVFEIVSRLYDRQPKIILHVPNKIYLSNYPITPSSYLISIASIDRKISLLN